MQRALRYKAAEQSRADQMKLTEHKITDISYRVYTGKLDTQTDQSLLVLQFSGSYGYGSAGALDGAFMAAMTQYASEMLDCDAILFDLRDLSYEWGNNIWNAYPRHMPYAVVVSDKCRAGFSAKYRCVGPVYFDEFDVAVTALQTQVSALAAELAEVEVLTEAVMSPGMRITATTAIGTLMIEALPDDVRVYTGEGFNRRCTLKPRCERWEGSYGFYAFEKPIRWEGTFHLFGANIEEGLQHFTTEDEALCWLNDKNLALNALRKTSNERYVACSGDGLVVIWSKNHHRKLLDISVWQVVINGEKPKRLLGSDDSIIKLEFCARDVPIGKPRS